MRRRFLILMWICIIFVLFSCDSSPQKDSSPTSGPAEPINPYLSSPLIGCQIPARRITALGNSFYGFTKTPYGTYAVMRMSGETSEELINETYYVSLTDSKTSQYGYFAYCTPMGYLNAAETGILAITRYSPTGSSLGKWNVFAETDRLTGITDAKFSLNDCIEPDFGLYGIAFTLTDVNAFAVFWNDRSWSFVKISNDYIERSAYSFPKSYLTNKLWAREDEIDGMVGYVFLEDGTYYRYLGEKDGLIGHWSVDGYVLYINGVAFNYAIIGNELFLGDINHPYRLIKYIPKQ